MTLPLRMMTPVEIAQGVVDALRSEGFVEYPYVPADLDEEIFRWCEVNSVEPLPPMLVREEIAALPDVKRWRPWLNAYDPVHRYIRRRQRAHGEASDRPTIYVLVDHVT